MSARHLLTFAVLVVLANLVYAAVQPDLQSSKSTEALYDFSLGYNSWTYYLKEKHHRNESIVCSPSFWITSNGVLFLKRCHTFTRSALRNGFTFRLTVVAENVIIPAKVTYSAVVLRKDTQYYLTLSHIHIELQNSPETLLANSLNTFLPKSLQNNDKNSHLRLSYQDWHILTDVPCRYCKSNVAETDIVVKVCDRTHVRLKRQLFSNLHSPIFTNAPYTVSVREEISINTQVKLVTADDADEGSAGAVKYSLHADADQRSLDVFQIDSDSGWVTTKSRVNREDIASHRFTVKARDQGSPANTAQATLTIVVEDINDHPPLFEYPVYNINVSEILQVGSTISRLLASDADIGKNKEIVYSILNPQRVPDFNINRNTGDISIARVLDRENVSSYSFVVKAEDQAVSVADRLSSTVTANILILDYNDNTPKFLSTNYRFEVREDVNISQGPAVIGDVSATDLDFGDNGIIR